MPYYRSVGEVPRKRHTQFRQPDGGLYAEELMGQEGFSSDSSLLYHRHLADRDRRRRELRTRPPRPGRPTCRSSRATCAPTSWTPAGPTPCSAASTCSPTTTSGSGTWSPTGRPRCYRDAVGDECLYVESGSGDDRDRRSACSSGRRATT